MKVRTMTDDITQEMHAIICTLCQIDEITSEPVSYYVKDQKHWACVVDYKLYTWK